MSLLRRLLAASVVAVALSLPSLVQGAAIIRVDSYYMSATGNMCTGITSSPTTFVAGVCSADAASSRQSSKRFCDESYSYQVTYSDATCTNVQEVKRTPNGCFSQQKYSCVNLAEGPAYTLGFPIAGFRSTKAYLNETTPDTADCPITTSAISFTQTSTQPGCRPAASLQQEYSSIRFCANVNGVDVTGQYDYQGLTCESGGSLTSGAFYPLCNFGEVVSCDATPALPTAPSVGVFTCPSARFPSYTVRQVGCTQGNRYKCTDGNLVYERFTNSDCTGATLEAHTWLADGKTCQPYSVTDATPYLFTCNAGSLITAYKPHNSAANLAASWVMVAVAALAAVVGSRQ